MDFINKRVVNSTALKFNIEDLYMARKKMTKKANKVSIKVKRKTKQASLTVAQALQLLNNLRNNQFKTSGSVRSA